jgi:hypothetical protein
MTTPSQLSNIPISSGYSSKTTPIETETTTAEGAAVIVGTGDAEGTKDGAMVGVRVGGAGWATNISTAEELDSKVLGTITEPSIPMA